MSNDYIDAQDEFSRYHTQVSSLLFFVTTETQSGEVTEGLLQDVLWLARDRLDDMQKAFDKLVDSTKEKADT